MREKILERLISKQSNNSHLKGFIGALSVGKCNSVTKFDLLALFIKKP